MAKIGRTGDHLKGNSTKRAVGRPKGAKSSQTKLKEALLCSTDSLITQVNDGTFVSPLQHLMNVYCDEKYDIITRNIAAKECLPYFHKKQPVATETTITTNQPTGFEIVLVPSSNAPKE
jgi:hypothetical protein